MRRDLNTKAKIMVTKTIGSGGDYADIGAAWNYLVSLGALASDYLFSIITPFTEGTGINYGSGVPKVYVNGHSITFIDYTQQNTISTSLPFQFLLNSPATVSDKIYVNGLKVTVTASGLGMSSGLFLLAPYIATEGGFLELKNLTLTGYTNNFLTTLPAIKLHRWKNVERVVNCRITNFPTAIDTVISDANTVGTSHVVENCSIYNCNKGVDLVPTTATKNVTIKNVVAVSSVTKDFDPGGANNTVTNCADSDNSIASSGAVLTANITGITSDDFESVDSTSSDFLKLPKGAINAVPVADPSKGSAPLSVSFESNAEYLFGARLAGTGIAPTLSTTDLAGNTYGQYGYYPIGCYNAEVA